MKFAAFFLFAAALATSAQPVLTVSGPSTVMAGNAIPVTVTLTGSAGLNIYGLGWLLNLPAGFTILNQGAVGAATAAAQDTVSCLPGLANCIDVGFNPATLAITSVSYADGIVASFSVSASPAAPAGSQTITLTNPAAVDAVGNAIPITSVGYNLTVVPANHCDLNSDGKVDGNDVNLVYLAFQGKMSCPVSGGCTLSTMRQVMSAAPVAIGGGGLACPF